MKFTLKDPPREFEVGFGPKVVMQDCAAIELAPNEQVTFVSKEGAEYDVARKDWGYYATPSLNGRLTDFGFRTALVSNRLGRRFVLLVQNSRQASFDAYLQDEGLQVLAWLDDDNDPMLSGPHAAPD